MDISLTFVEPLLTDFKNFYSTNKVDIDKAFTNWRLDEKLKGVSIEHYNVIDILINFIYIEIQKIELSFGTNWTKDDSIDISSISDLLLQLEDKGITINISTDTIII